MEWEVLKLEDTHFRRSEEVEALCFQVVCKQIKFVYPVKIYQKKQITQFKIYTTNCHKVTTEIDKN